MLSIGLMSGTSMDGIDAALLETDGSVNLIRELGNVSISYDANFKTLLKAAEHAIRKSHGDMSKATLFFPNALENYLLELGISKNEIADKLVNFTNYLKTPSITLSDVISHSTYLHGVAVKKLLEEFGYTSKQIDVVGYHGQTMFHRPVDNISVIVGNGQMLADDIGITVVNDFRSNDIAAGGQGAPFAPLYHQALALKDKKMPVAFVNCGGISNITLVNGEHESDLLAYDTGPGNGLIDRFVKQRTQGKESMDTDGHYGKKGKVNEATLKKLYEKSILVNGKNYFSLSPPKSLDIGDMTLIAELDALSLEDACRTLEVFTADSIINSLQLINTNIPKYWVLVGGGWYNPIIRAELEKKLHQTLGEDTQVFTADEIGWNSQAMEAQVFAYLAVRSLQNKPLSFPTTTRVPQPVSGGRTYIPHSGPTSAVEELL